MSDNLFSFGEENDQLVVVYIIKGLSCPFFYMKVHIYRWTWDEPHNVI